MASTRYRAVAIGHTGAGNFGHGLDIAWRGLESVEMVAVADPDEAGRARAKERSGARNGYADYREMLEKERPALVAIGTRWPDQHEEMFLAAVAAGARGIFCEKPLAQTLAQVDRMLAAADAAGVKVAVAHQQRAMAPVIELRRIVQSGELGEIREVRGRPTIGTRGGSFLYEALGSHILDLFRWLFGDPRWVSGRVAMRDGREATVADAVEANERYGPLAGDAVHGMFGFDNGVTGFCDSYWAPEVLDPTMVVEVWGTEGVAAMRHGAAARELWRWQKSSKRPIHELEHVPLPGWDDDLELANAIPPLNDAMARDLIRCIEQGGEPLVSGHDGRWALEMIWGTHESHLAGRRVPLPCPQRENPYAARR